MSYKKESSIFETYASAFARLTDEGVRWEKERELLLSLTSTPGNSSKWALDLACGSGFHARHLAQEGINVTGIDLSSAAIAAGMKMSGGDLVDWQVGDITRSSEGEYDLALLLGNTLSLFNDKTQVEEIIQGAASALKPSGTLIIQVLDYEFLRSNPVMVERKLELDNENAVFTKRIDPTEGGGVITVQLTFPDSPGRDNESEVVNLTEWKAEELIGFAENSGMALEGCFGGMDKSPYQPGGSRDLVVILRK